MNYKTTLLKFSFLLWAGCTLAQPVNAQNTSDPCPEPKKAMNETPDSMAKVQEDIDRFILCVERAQLLDRLNTMVEKNIETIDSVLLKPAPMPVDTSLMGDIFGGMGGGAAQTGGQTAPPPVDENALASAGDGGNFGGGDDMGEEMAEPEEPVWLIREINGKSGSLMGNIINSDGKLARVKQGDALPDDSRVVEITPTNIKIKKEQEILDLNWVNDEGTGQ